MPFPADLAADSLIGIILGLAQRNRGRKTSRLDVPARDWRVGKSRKSVALLPRPTNARRPARCRISVQILLSREHPAAVSVKRLIWPSGLLNSSAGSSWPGPPPRRIAGSCDAPAVTSGLAGPVFARCMLTSDFTTMVAALAATSVRALRSRGQLQSQACGRRPAGRRHARRCAEERFWRPSRELFAAVGGGYDHGGGRCWAAGSIRSDIQRASWFDQPAASSLPFVFVTVFTQATSRRPDSLSVR